MDVLRHLQILPVDLKNEGYQKCIVGSEVFKNLGAKLGQGVVIDMKGNFFICTLWPRINFNKYIQFDDTVYFMKSKHCNYQLDRETVHLKNNQLLDIESLKLRKLVEFDTVAVDVVAQDPSHFRKLSNDVKKLQNIVQDLLRFSVFSTNAVINVHRKLSKQFHGIEKVIVNVTSGKNLDTCGKIHENTTVTISSIYSKQKYEQKSSFQNICLGGIESAKQSLKQLIDIPFKNKEELQRLGISCPKSVLLRGPSGCGKTSLVKLVAHECDAFLLTIDSTDIIGSRPGESEQNLSNIFERALLCCKEGPCILFLDEVDSYGSKGRRVNKAIGQLVQLLDKLNEIDERLLVVAATNQPGTLDPVLRRPGRLEQEIFIGIPNHDQREEILKAITKGIALSDDVRLKGLAEATPGYVAADLQLIIKQAYYNALDKSFSTQSNVVVNQVDLSKALHCVTPSTQKGSDVYVEHKPVQWRDIGGLDQVKEQIRQAIELPLCYPEAFARLGIPCPKGVLLYGPPGCAKTTLVRAAATSCHVTFLSVSSAQLYSPFVGDSEKKLSEIFKQARAGAPCILFFDEIDSLVGSRSSDSKQGKVQERLLSTLLNELDGIGIKLDLQQGTEIVTSTKEMEVEGEHLDSRSHPCTKLTEERVNNSSVLLVAATNRPDMLDDAILRPGRIDRIIYVPPPDKQGRKEILKVHTQKMAVDSDLDYDILAERTSQLTGAELENLCREAALYALSVDGLDVTSVKQQHFQTVLNSTQPLLTKTELEKYSHIKWQC